MAEPQPAPAPQGGLSVVGTRSRLNRRPSDAAALPAGAGYFCIVPSAPAEQLCTLISLFLEERGWQSWPHEDWFESETSGEMLRRPADARKVGFCNCSSYCSMSCDIRATEWAYDRLMLADLAPDLCPPSYKIKSGALVGCTAAEFEESCAQIPALTSPQIFR